MKQRESEWNRVCTSVLFMWESWLYWWIWTLAMYNCISNAGYLILLFTRKPFVANFFLINVFSLSIWQYKQFYHTRNVHKMKKNPIDLKKACENSEMCANEDEYKWIDYLFFWHHWVLMFSMIWNLSFYPLFFSFANDYLIYKMHCSLFISC